MYQHRQALYFRFITGAFFPFHCESITKITVFDAWSVQLKLLKGILLLACAIATLQFVDAST